MNFRERKLELESPWRDVSGINAKLGILRLVYAGDAVG
jgi:hypothetical protein